jgi:hypothetical protein
MTTGPGGLNPLFEDMKKCKSETDLRKGAGIVQLARLRVEAAEKVWEAAKERARVARRRRKEAKQAARRAKKQVKLAKREVAEAKKVLADAEAKLARTGKRRTVSASGKKATGSTASPAAKSKKPKRPKLAATATKPRSRATAQPGQAVEPAVPTNQAALSKPPPTPGETAA